MIRLYIITLMNKSLLAEATEVIGFYIMTLYMEDLIRDISKVFGDVMNT